ncbi:unnamed protein product [Paramecium pentaurelia]|uniref:Uncharacterized protein n=1 Tax=Paramecium pentaurelia TaxID=43138 RepID=A0A8S1VES6_9CILI|nr:unnamed protein product [Paramecium pentaurelia]
MPMLNGHINSVNSVCISPDGNTLASGSDDCFIILWDINTGEQKVKLGGHTNTIYSVCFSLDGFLLGSGSSDYTVRLWDIQTGTNKTKLDGHINNYQSVCFSPYGNIFTLGSDHESIRLWDVITGIEIQPADNNYREVLEKSKTLIQQNNSITNFVNSNIPLLVLSTNPYLQSNGTLVLKGEFVTFQGEDLRILFQQRGSYILDTLVDITQKKNDNCVIS